MNHDTWRDPNDVDVMYASTYAIDEKRFTMLFRLHTPTFDRAATVALLKELMWHVAGRGGGDEGRQAKGGDKENLTIEGGEKPQQQISAASQNNTDKEANGCIGPQCLIDVNEEADLFIDQLDVCDFNPKTNQAQTNGPACPPGCSYIKSYSTSCIENSKIGLLSVTNKCEPTNRAPPSNYLCRI
ncbi:hypothetical protein A2U01_0000820 [Trifolium medium]|uniref:Uncharacterized protein n=1 Tax=Trifolium medium TaxID=97028 RepID=A0A392LZA2_9FABA|nr:hypothetical protein [Trifolium medium]